MATEDGRDDVPEAVQRLLCRDPDVELVVAFGSRVQGTAGPTSDLDLAVKFSDDLTAEERFRKRCRLSGRLQETDAPFVDLSDVEDLSLEFARSAVDGELLCGDRDAFESFRAQIRGEYDDRREDIEERRRALIRRIAAEGLHG